MEVRHRACGLPTRAKSGLGRGKRGSRFPQGAHRNVLQNPPLGRCQLLLPLRVVVQQVPQGPRVARTAVGQLLHPVLRLGGNRGNGGAGFLARGGRPALRHRKIVVQSGHFGR